jgi:hypothetical protein
MGQFVDHNVFEAFLWLSGQVGVQADGGGGSAATSPFGFHSLDVETVEFYSDQRFPFSDYGGRGGFELGSVPVIEDGLFLFRGGVGS